jgi:tape measure domain-containing protein
MPSIDERIVSIAFENRKFESAVNETMRTLDKLESALQKVGAKNSLADIEKSANKVTLTQPMSALDKLKTRLFGAGSGASKGMSDIEKAGGKVTLSQPLSALGRIRSESAQVGSDAARGFGEIERSSGRITLSNLTGALDSVTAKFSILRGAAAVALGNIATRAIATGTQVLKSLTLAPVMEGFHNYETQINAVQTIMANTGLTGKKGLGQVQKALNNLNTYANKTVYNFSEMARNIGTFTAAGVDLKTAVGSIKGIANLAALSGSTSQQASSAMYQLSQAIAAGRVNLQDWNSVVNAGIGGKVFQKALANTAVAMGTLKDGSVKMVGPMKKLNVQGLTFRQSIQSKPGKNSWLTSEVLTNTLKQFTGDMSKAQLKAQGFTDAQIGDIQKQGKVATDAATKIKTITQLMQALKEEVASAWATIFKTIFGNIFEARKLFSKLHNVVQNALTKPIYAMNRVLQGWVKLGGRIQLLDALKQGAKDIGAIIKPIKAAFRDIFPPTTARQLFSITKRFHDLMERLKIGPKTADNLRRTFRGFFALLDVGRKIISGIVGAFLHMFGTLGHGAGGFLSFTATVGDALVVFRDWLTQGDRLKKFFATLATVLAAPAKLISGLLHALGKFFNSDIGSNTADSLNKLNTALDPTARLAQVAQKAWSGLTAILKTVAKFLHPVIQAVGDGLSKVGHLIANAFNSGNVDKLLAGVQVGLIGGIFLAIKKAIGGGVGFNFKAEVGGLSKALGIMTTSLTSMQRAVQAATLLEIAAAVGLLAISVAILAKIDDKKIASSMTAMSIGLGQLVGAMYILGRTSGKGVGFAKLPVIAAAMILLATALGILTTTMLIMAQMDWQQIGKGLAGVTGLLFGLSIAVQPLSKASPTLVLTSTGLIAVGAALVIIAGAMKIFATMQWVDIAKGLAGVAGGLIAIGVGMKLLGPQTLLIGPGLIAVSIALNILAASMKIFATMKWEDLAKGVAAIAGSLVAIGLAMSLMPITLPITAAGLIILGVALTSLSGVIAILGHMKIGTLAKGIIAIGAALGVLALGLTLMSGSLPGAAALLVAAGALAIFAPTLAVLGNLKWGTIGKGLLVIAASMVVIGVTGLVAAPALIALGVALAILGVGVLAVGAGVKLMASGFALLSDSGKGLAIFLASFTAFIALIPKIIIEFVKGLVDIADSIVKLAPPLIKALGEIITMLIALVIKEVPKFAHAIAIFIGAFTNLIIKETPRIVAAGFGLILGLLRGLDKNIDEVTTRALSILTKFLKAFADGAPQLVDAGANLIVKFLEGFAKHISEIATKGLDIVSQLIIGIGNGTADLIRAGGMMLALISQGIGEAAFHVIKAAFDTATTFINNVVAEIPRQVDKVATGVIRMINRLAKVVRKREPEFIGAVFNVGIAIAEGIISGLARLPKMLLDKVKHALSFLPGPIKDFFHLNLDSPDKADNRLLNLPSKPISPFKPPSGLGKLPPPKKSTRAVKSSIEAVKSAFPDLRNLQPTITPVLDLSSVHKEAKKMPRMVAPTGLSADATLRHARAILAQTELAAKVRAEAPKKAATPSVSFVQNNHSPEALSEREIYRRTQNQLSKIKKEMRKHHAKN